VAVPSVLGERLALSMKDVDQATGKDLCPDQRSIRHNNAPPTLQKAGGP
jgi:hypothetical protein